MRYASALLLLLLVLMLMARPAAPGDWKPAERLFLHGEILTGEGLTSQPRRVSALAVRGDRVLFAGSDEDVTHPQGPAPEIVDLHGAFVMPGFNDAHVHLAAAGALALACDLRGAASLADMLARVQQS